MGFALTVVLPWQMTNAWLQLYAQTAMYPLTLFNALAASR